VSILCNTTDKTKNSPIVTIKRMITLSRVKKNYISRYKRVLKESRKIKKPLLNKTLTFEMLYLTNKRWLASIYLITLQALPS